MKLHYSVSIEDYIAYYEWQVTSSPGHKHTRWLTTLVNAAAIMAPFLFLALITREANNQYIWKAMLLLGVILCLPYILGASKQWEKDIRAAFQGKKALGHFGKFSLELIDDALLLTSDTEETKIKLSRVTEIVQIATHIFIFMGPTVYVLPHEKIEEGNIEKFIGSLEEKRPPASDSSEAPEEVAVNNKKVQPAVWLFAAAGLCAFAGIVPYLALASGGYEDKIELCKKACYFSQHTQLCKINAIIAEVFWGSCTLGAYFLLASLVMFYFNRKKNGAI